MPRVCTVVPHWNGVDFLPACLDSLLAQALPPGVEHTVVLVDNGSVDGSPAMVRDRYPDVDLVALPANLGFAGGVNRGIDRARALGADAVALLNNDAVADPGWLAGLLRVIDARPEVGIVAARSVREDDGRLDTAGDSYSVYGVAFPRGRDEPDDGRYADVPEVFAASGGSSLTRMAVLDDVGGFAEEFFAYYEDVDLSFRARLRGWHVAYAADARVVHGVNRTSSTMGDFVRHQLFKNRLLLWLRCMPGPLAVRYLPQMLAGLAWQLASDATRGRLGTDARATAEVVRLLPHTLRERRRIQSRRTASVAELDRVLHHGWPSTMRSPSDRLRALAARSRGGRA